MVRGPVTGDERKPNKTETVRWGGWWQAEQLGPIQQSERFSAGKQGRGAAGRGREGRGRRPRRPGGTCARRWGSGAAVRTWLQLLG